MVSGFFNIHKPVGITSHDVVARLRRWTNIKRIGHAGTLDPAATGVLPIAIGTATRLIPYLDNDKIYLAEILLGVSTTTDDLDGSVMAQYPVPASMNKTQIESVLRQYTGLFEQKPPLYSAVQQNGQRLYDLARRTLENELKLVGDSSKLVDTTKAILADIKTRPVNIDKIELLQINLPVLKIRIFCSAGTYIRALARDIGQLIGCGACLKSLCREKSGVFTIDTAMHLAAMETLIKDGQLQEALLTPDTVLSARVIQVELPAAVLLAQGRSLNLETIAPDWTADTGSNYSFNEHCLVVYPGRSPARHAKPVALCIISKDKLIKPKVVLTHLENLH